VFEEFDHCKVPLPKPDVPPGHPFRNKATHDALLRFLQQRLIYGKNNRDAELIRLVNTDKKVAGWLKLSQEDIVRQQTQEATGDPVITKVNLPLSWVHIDDIMTYFAQTFAPNRGMFYHTANPDETSEASQIVSKMNNDAIQSGAYREILQGLYSLLKYNKGGYWLNWTKELGPNLVQRDADSPPETEMQIRWQGNRMEAVDNYNFFYDPSVPLHRLHVDGEFVARADIRSHYWLQSKAAAGQFYNCEDALEDDCMSNQMTYYRNPPQEASLNSINNTGQDTNWVSILSETAGYVKANGYELVTIYIRINPNKFALIPKASSRMRDRYEVWRFTILNDEKIIDATYMNNIHGYLPCMVGTMNDDIMGAAAKSVSEILTPLQDFASFLVNTHISATRANLYGTTFYDPTMVDLDSVPAGEVAARVKVKPAAYGKDIRQYVYQMQANQDTGSTLQDLDSVMNLINQFFPTQSLPSQIASIDRAVSNQVAAVQQGANRRQQKAARLLDDSIFRNVRFAMYYNIIQYAPEREEFVDAFTGKPVVLDIQALRNSNLPFIIGQGLKAIDRMAAASMLQEIIFALIQAPQVAQQLDLLGLIDYWTSMIDVDIDMKQFRLKPSGQVGPDGQPIMQNTDGTPAIVPATAPGSVTEPLRE